MITGFNTDVDHGGVVYHVQTEDTGRANPCIESMIYVGGRVLGAKRSSYHHLLAEGKGKKEILELMDRQHRTMIAAIRKGMYDEEAPTGAASASLPEAETPPSSPHPTPEPGTALPPRAPLEVESETSRRSLDQVILDYLSSEAAQEQLVLVMDTTGELALGSRSVLSITTSSSRTGQPVQDARILVNLISTVAAAVTLAEGTTGQQGQLRAEIEIPPLQPGTAALIVIADSAIGKAEIKQLL